MNKLSLIGNNRSNTKVVNSAKPQFYSTSRNYQEILNGQHKVRPVSETIIEFIKSKFSSLSK